MAPTRTPCTSTWCEYKNPAGRVVATTPGYRGNQNKMAEHARGVLDAVFAKPMVARVKKESKNMQWIAFLQTFVNSVIKKIEHEHAGKIVAFGDELRFSVYYVSPEDLREELPSEQSVVDALEFGMRFHRYFTGFDVKVESTEYRHDEVTVSIRRMSNE